MMEKMKNLKNSIINRVSALRSDENGMEAAQVILILVIVVVVLIPVITTITNALKTRGNEVVNGINGVKK